MEQAWDFAPLLVSIIMIMEKEPLNISSTIAVNTSYSILVEQIYSKAFYNAFNGTM